MKVKIIDKNQAPYSTIGAGTRAKIFKSLALVSEFLPADHALHANVDSIVTALGGEISVKNIDDSSPGTIDRNVDARGQGAPQAPGASAVADKSAGTGLAGKAKLRDAVVIALYRKAAFEKDRDRKAVYEKAAMELGSLDLRDVNEMTEADWAAYRNGDEAAIKKAQRRTGGNFTELFKAGAKPSGDRSTFAGRHGG
jgi:hypothetical protein